MTDKDSKARQLNRISSCIRDQIAVAPLPQYYACKISCNALRKISTSIANQLQKKRFTMVIKNIGYWAPESSDKSPRNLRPLTIRTRANNVRSLFLNELCNFSANSWAEDQRDANELGFCAGGVVWVDPYDAERKAAQDLTCLRALPGERALNLFRPAAPLRAITLIDVDDGKPLP